MKTSWFVSAAIVLMFALSSKVTVAQTLDANNLIASFIRMHQAYERAGAN